MLRSMVPWKSFTFVSRIRCRKRNILTLKFKGAEFIYNSHGQTFLSTLYSAIPHENSWLFVSTSSKGNEFPNRNNKSPSANLFSTSSASVSLYTAQLNNP